MKTCKDNDFYLYQFNRIEAFHIFENNLNSFCKDDIDMVYWHRKLLLKADDMLGCILEYDCWDFLNSHSKCLYSLRIRNVKDTSFWYIVWQLKIEMEEKVRIIVSMLIFNEEFGPRNSDRLIICFSLLHH